MILDNIIEKTLDNGMKVIALKKSGTPILSVQLWYRSGSSSEVRGIRGISHFIEHCMFRGSRRFGPEEHARRINDAGGHCNAFTAEDITAYINSVPSDSLEMVLEMEADRMDGLTFDPQLLETERKVIVEEYHTYMNNPVAKAFLEFRSDFYRDHPYAISPLGLIEDISTFSVDQCKSYYRRHYTPDNAVAVVVGDSEEERIFDTVAAYFSEKKRSDASRAGSAAIEVDPDAGARRMERKVEFDVPVAVIGFPAPPSQHPDALPLEILQLIAAGGETSRLYREVVRRQSLAVMTGGMNHLLRSSGMSIFFAAFTPDIRPGKVEQAVDAELHRIKNEGITAEEMEKVRNTTLTNRTFELYSVENICQRIGYSETIEGNYRLWVERLTALEKLKTDQCIEVARRWWDDSKKHVLFLKPRRTNPLLFAGGFLRRLLRPGTGKQVRHSKDEG
ncbi:MAG: insulinase family protein [Chitinispirillaceae bacterium]|nr:insulinase family protein [Chitinispirillaceae bacterium]